MTVEATSVAPKHARKHEHIHPGYKKKKKKSSVSIQTIICAGVNFVGGYKWHASVVLFELFVTNLLVFQHQRRTAR